MEAAQFAKDEGRKSFRFKVSRVVDPNLNGNNLFALLQIDADIRVHLDS